MVKITVEEVEILITARVEDEVKKNIPKIKKMVNQIKQEFEKVDLGSFQKKVSKQIQETFNPNSTKGIKINGVELIQKQLKGYSKSIKNFTGNNDLKMLKEKQDAIRDELLNFKPIKAKDYFDPNDTSGIKISGLEIPKIKDFSNQKYTYDKETNNKSNVSQIEVKMITKVKEEQKKVSDNAKKISNEYTTWTNILRKYYALLDQAKLKISQMKQKIEETGNGQNKLTTFSNKFKDKISKAGISVNSLKNNFNKIPNITSKINSKIKQMGKGMKTGIGQVLKYAGALFSLRSIYNILSNSAQSWLSSQNTQAKQLSANIEYMKYAMGSAFAPVIEYVTNLVYKLMKAIQTVIYSLFKVNIFANASADSYSSMADSASSAAKETKTLAGFDEINNIGGSDDNSSSGSGTTTPSFDLSNVDSSLLDWYQNLDFTELGKTVADKINTSLSNIDWTSIQSGAKTIAENIGNFINGFVEKTDWSLLGKTVAGGINTGITFVNTFLTTVNFKNIGSSIATFLCSAIKETDWGGLGKAVSESIGSIFDTITGFFKDLDWESIIDAIVKFVTGIDWGRVASSISEALGTACASLVNLGMVIGEKIGEAIESAKKYFQSKIEECGGNVVLGILKGIVDGLKSIGQWVIDNIFKPFIDGFKNAFGIHSPSTKMAEMGGYIIDGLKNGLKGIWDKVKSIFTNLYNSIKDKFNSIKDKVHSIAENLKNGVKDKFNSMKEKVYTVVNNLRNGVKDKFNSMKDKVYTVVNNLRNGVKDKFNSIKDKIGTIVTNIKNGVTSKFQTVKDKAESIFKTMKKTISDIFGGIWDKIKKVINSILGGIESMANGVVKGINKVIDALNNLNFKIPDWVPGGYGGKSFGLNLKTMNEISIPRLATGNVATEETLAIFGEYSNARTNPEITAPQNIIYETTKQAIMDSSTNNSGNNNSMPQTLVIKFGSYRVAYEMEDLIRKARRQNGTATATI